MRTIQEGVRRFRQDVWPQLEERFTELARGQSPETLFVTCSDSRIDPSLITQTLPGELFVLRNAGNLVPVHGVDAGSAAAVEYAVAVLGVKDIVVCGHSSCGAMQGVLSEGGLPDLPTVEQWVEHARPSADATAHVDDEHRLSAIVAHNAQQQLQNLMTHPAVARAVETGTVKLHAWVFDIATGRVDELETPELASSAAK